MQMKKRLTLILLTLSLAGVLSIAGCGKSDEEATSDNTFSTEDEVTADGAEDTENTEEAEDEVAPEGMYRSELTNEWISEDLKDQRPIAVMVDNEKTALPHYGLTPVSYTHLKLVMKGFKSERFEAFFTILIFGDLLYVCRQSKDFDPFR